MSATNNNPESNRLPNSREIYSVLVFWADRTTGIREWSTRFWEKFPAANLDVIYPAAFAAAAELDELCAAQYPVAQPALTGRGIPARFWRQLCKNDYDAVLIAGPAAQDQAQIKRLCAVIKPRWVLLIDETAALRAERAGPILAAQLSTAVFWIYTLSRCVHTAGFCLALFGAWLQSRSRRRKPEAES